MDFLVKLTKIVNNFSAKSIITDVKERVLKEDKVFLPYFLFL